MITYAEDNSSNGELPLDDTDRWLRWSDAISCPCSSFLQNNSIWRFQQSLCYWNYKPVKLQLLLQNFMVQLHTTMFLL